MPLFGNDRELFGQNRDLEGQGRRLIGQDGSLANQGDPFFGQDRELEGQGNRLFGQDRELQELYYALAMEEGGAAMPMSELRSMVERMQESDNMKQLMESVGQVPQRKQLSPERIHNLGVLYGQPLSQERLDYFEDQLNRNPDDSYMGEFPTFPD